jgi:hypothetical protein
LEDKTYEYSTMAASEPLPLQAMPYEWNDEEPPPTETLNLWSEVGNGIDKSQTGEQQQHIMWSHFTRNCAGFS